MLYRFICACIFSMLLAFPLGAAASGITNYDKLVSADFWCQKNPQGNQVILDAQEVQVFNEKVRHASSSVPDLLNYPASISGSDLKAKIMNYTILEDELYLHGNKVSENYKKILRSQTNANSIPAKVVPRYGVIVRRSSLRNLPIGEGLFYYAGDTDFDALQETELDPGEPVVVLHQSANKFFYYIQSLNYSGWISTFNIAFTDAKTWRQFADPEEFLVVTDSNLTLKIGSEQVVYQQGSKLPLLRSSEVYQVLTPMRKKDGTLMTEKLFIKKDNTAVHEGYLPYTSNNIIRSAFKFYGMPYGWGGMKKSVDCSSLLFNAYRTVGITLPRNADEQETTAGVIHSLDGQTDGQKLAVINQLIPGSGLYMDGHCLMYLGNINNEPYGLHALGSYVNAKGERVVTMKVVVSDLTLRRGTGESFLESLTSAVEFK